MGNEGPACGKRDTPRFLSLRFPERMSAKDVAFKIPAVCADTSLDDIISMLIDGKTPHFVVVDDDGNLLGIVTEDDLLKLISRPSIPTGVGSIVSKEAKFRASSTVKDIMTRHPIFVYATQSLDEVVATMRKYSVGHVAVVDDNKHVVGLIDKKQLLVVLQILK